MKEVKNILFYDGACGLCNRSVQFVLRHEKNHELFFSPLQSDFAKQALSKYAYDFSDLGTFALVLDGKVYYKSDAALNLAKFWKVPYSWLIAFKIVPRFIRNGVYDWVARNRKKWFKENVCVVPNAQTRDRFIN